jgi:hypothetical protein
MEMGGLMKSTSRMTIKANGKLTSTEQWQADCTREGRNVVDVDVRVTQGFRFRISSCSSLSAE